MPTKILGKPIATAEQMAKYLLSVNPNPIIPMDLLSFCRLYLYMGAVEGVRGDILFAQSCKETGNFKFKGTVKPEQNNFAGLGTVNTGTQGAFFPDAATGILAQAQHAKGYDGTPLSYECMDPRYEVLIKYEKIGIAKNWEELGGAWAVPGYDTKKYKSLKEANEAKDSYGYQVMNIFNNILKISTGETPKEEEKPVEKNPLADITLCLDPGHYKKANRSPGVPEYYESEVMWDYHLIFKKEIEALGFKVITTRTDENKDLGLKERGMASKGCQLFLSLHSNAVGSVMNEGIDHVAVYHLVDDSTTDVDEISKAVAERLAPVIADVMGVEDGFRILTRKSSNDRNKDGIMNDNYYGVLNGARQANTPGLILEHGFHTHTKTVKWLMNTENLKKLAKAEAQALAEYFLGHKTQEEPEDVKEFVPYTVRITTSPLNIRAGASVDTKAVGCFTDDPILLSSKPTYYKPRGLYTIVEESNGWGKLKSGIGWINLSYTKKVQ